MHRRDFVPRFGIVHPSKQETRAHTLSAPDGGMGGTRQAPARRGATGVFKGMLVMPTGSGKTHTAVDWLLRNWIDDGGRVLWIAHRDELLRRRRAPSIASPASRHARSPADSTRLRPALPLSPDRSSRRCRPLLRAQSCARAGRCDASPDPRIFVVIDEAHHAPAKSYRDAIRVLEAAASHRLLGLTATPTRTAEDERPELARLFGDRILYQVTPNELIARELLARPVPATVSTGVDAEKEHDDDDFEHLRDFHDLSAEMRARLGRDEHRNLGS